MREIKYRAWHKVNNEFEYATLKDVWENGFRVAENLQWNGSNHTSYLTQEELTKWEGDSFVYNAEWQQYTGFKDKNGKEIYEGDICKRILDKRHRFIHDEEWFDLWFIEWLDSTCGFTTTYIEKGGKLKRNSFSQRFVEMDEVIGNIYENLELLKENL